MQDLGYNDFLNGIATVVMGRASYDQVFRAGLVPLLMALQCIGFGHWPYPKQKSIVLSKEAVSGRRALAKPTVPEGHAAPDIELLSGDDLPALVNGLRAGNGDVWV